MAQVNSIVSGKFSGQLGKEIVFRDWAGKTVVAKSPKSRKGAPSAEQAEIQERFLYASKFAKAVVNNDDKGMAEAYTAVLRPRQNVYARAVQDFMSSPVVSKVDVRNYTGAIGNTLKVRAIDDFRVVSVRVEIYAAAGTLIEAGNSTLDSNGIDWIYTATKVNSQLPDSRIVAIATDVPGNEGAMEVSI
ncbi:hypothetical protein [Paraflavitalea pollutisoli]|uniref:hypothetical protein n=1 Tax=Paraflavitalea pollutisoli TaxID=3034143 RepID=UPI0023ED0018|nr:hypothetical protein [Paraflavitalea sp. H1-2-19X]